MATAVELMEELTKAWYNAFREYARTVPDDIEEAAELFEKHGMKPETLREDLEKVIEEMAPDDLEWDQLKVTTQLLVMEYLRGFVLPEFQQLVKAIMMDNHDRRLAQAVKFN